MQKAISALVEGDSSLGEAVAMDDFKVNNMEMTIDEECSRILATRQPAAGDLRVIVAIIKTITDLERIGDEGEKIGYIASRLATMERRRTNIGRSSIWAALVQDMVHGALDAFARMDAEAALQVARQDIAVDEEYESIQRQTITFMLEDPRTIRRHLDVMWVVRSLERIGDHAKNIGEYVIYMVHGRDVRHRIWPTWSANCVARRPTDAANKATRPSADAQPQADQFRGRGLSGDDAFALYTEYFLNLEPCPLCIFQRIG